MNTYVDKLLAMPLWQMTGEEYLALHTYACNNNRNTKLAETQTSIKVTGVRALADYLQCCESTIYSLLRHKVLDSAIISRIGKRIVFDGEVARHCANDYQEQQRAQRSAGNIA